MHGRMPIADGGIQPRLGITKNFIEIIHGFGVARTNRDCKDGRSGRFISGVTNMNGGPSTRFSHATAAMLYHYWQVMGNQCHRPTFFENTFERETAMAASSKWTTKIGAALAVASLAAAVPATAFADDHGDHRGGENRSGFPGGGQPRGGGFPGGGQPRGGGFPGGGQPRPMPQMQQQAPQPMPQQGPRGPQGGFGGGFQGQPGGWRGGHAVPQPGQPPQPGWQGNAPGGDRGPGRPGWNNDGGQGRPGWNNNNNGQGRPGWNNNGGQGRPGWNNNGNYGRPGWNNDRGPGRPGWGDNRGPWRNDWRQDRRYDWQGWRSDHRDLFRGPRYFAPMPNYRYSRLNIGIYLGAPFFAQQYWIADPWAYRLPPAYPPYRWVRYYDDVVLIDTYTGQVVDVIYDFFW